MTEMDWLLLPLLALVAYTVVGLVCTFVWAIAEAWQRKRMERK